jgi:magnesium chelatase subunit D
MNSAAAWCDAVAALALFAADPVGLGGIAVRAGPGPVRDRWLALLRDALPPRTPLRRLPPHTADDRLLGGLDLAATLRAGRPIEQKGILAEADGGVVLLAMAERVEPAVAARLCGVMDLGAVALLRDGLSLHLPARFGLVALDEGIEPDEGTPIALLDRMAFHIDLTGVTLGDAMRAESHGHERLPLSQGEGKPFSHRHTSHPHSVQLSRSRPAFLPSAPDVLCATAMSLGIASIRAPILALRAAQTAAARDGRAQVEEADLALAARLVLGPRATCLPPDEPQPQPGREPPPPSDDSPAEAQALGDRPLADVVLEAAQAALPPDLLARLSTTAAGRIRSRAAGRAGQMQASSRRGRPIGTRQGDLRSGTRLHVMETLKAAAPWQKLRRQAARMAPPHHDVLAGPRIQRPGGGSGPSATALPGPAPQIVDSGPAFAMTRTGQSAASSGSDTSHQAAGVSQGAYRIEVRRDDFRIIRFQQRTETTTVFAVDASGSAALHRLNEAKGAVELLLADCYVRRDQVALIGFRGRDATLLLPPTGSLVRAKRCLAGLPGGGATPLAAGIDAAAALADAVRRRGRTPVITLLTDGRANIGRDGTGGRPRGEAEALDSARRLRATGIAALLVDTSPRPNPFARRLAETMGARYVPLPYADASALSRAVRSAATA